MKAKVKDIIEVTYGTPICGSRVGVVIHLFPAESREDGKEAVAVRMANGSLWSFTEDEFEVVAVLTDGENSWGYKTIREFDNETIQYLDTRKYPQQPIVQSERNRQWFSPHETVTLVGTLLGMLVGAVAMAHLAGIAP